MENKELRRLAEKHLTRQKDYEEIRRESSKDVIEFSKQFKDSVRDLSLVSGGIAAAGLASLGIPVSKSAILVMHGSLLLLLLTSISFSYLLFVHWKEGRVVMRGRESILVPLEGVLNSFDGMLFHKTIPVGEYVEKEKAFEREILEKHTRNSSADHTKDNIEIFLISAFVSGIVLIVMGFLSPLLFS